MVFKKSSLIKINNTQFSDNKSRLNGGHIVCDGGSLLITNSLFCNGSSDRGGAISVTNSQLQLDESKMKGNSAPIGSSIYCHVSNTSISGTNLEYNGHGSVFCYGCRFNGANACRFWDPYTILFFTLLILSILLIIFLYFAYKIYKKKKEENLYKLINEKSDKENGEEEEEIVVENKEKGEEENKMKK